MSQNGKLMPNLDQHSTKLLNLTVLQRIDPFVEEILITAAHVTFYEFNIDLSQWSRKDVEGSLFVVKRIGAWAWLSAFYTQHLALDIVPYLLYRNAAQEVNGIWFYNARECEEVANLFSRILNAYAKVPPKSKVSSTKSEFEELEAVPTMAVMDGPLEPSPSTTSNVADIPDDPSFAAMAIGNTSNAPITGQPYQSSATMSSSSVPTHAATPHCANLADTFSFSIYSSNTPA
ncbi:PH-like domain superfamily [Sesbania bispinosa]|nr:PH-like domain superfamily [Sesbania bispinosa]